MKFDPSQMSRLEQGDANPTYSTVRRIAAALDVSLAELAKLAEYFEERLRDEDGNGLR